MDVLKIKLKKMSDKIMIKNDAIIDLTEIGLQEYKVSRFFIYANLKMVRIDTNDEENKYLYFSFEDIDYMVSNLLFG